MDPLSAGASVIAILQAVGSIPKIIDTLRTLIHIGDEIKALSNELSTLLALQDRLENQINLLSTTDPRLRVPEPKSMQSARTTIADLVLELEELVKRYEHRKRRRIQFVWNRKKIAQMGAKTRAAREELGMAMQDLNLTLMNTHGKILLEIHSFTTLIPEIIDERGTQRVAGWIATTTSDNNSSMGTTTTLTPAPPGPGTPFSQASTVFPDLVPASIPVPVPARAKLPSPSPLWCAEDDAFSELLTVGRLLTADDTMDDFDDNPHLNNNNATISMKASVYSPSSSSASSVSSTACPQSCSCHCHLSCAVRTPTWLQPVLGSVLLSYNCIPLFGGTSPCNQADCVRASSRVDLTYYFPARVLKRALCFSVEVGGAFGYGAGLHFGVPRVFSSHDEAWDSVNFGGVEDLKRVWQRRPGAYSPLDVTEAGMSLLMDALSRKNTKAAMFLIETWGLRESKRPCDRFTIMFAREMVSLPESSNVSSASELEPLMILASLSPDGSRTPFSSIHQAIQSGCSSSLSSILASSSSLPLDLNQRDFLGRTPLIHASRIGNLRAVQMLIRAGAGSKKLIDVRDSLGQTALLAALVGGHIRIALALLNAGCSVRVANDMGRTPLHAIFRAWDSWNPHPKAAEVLARLIQGGDVSARSSYGYTPLHYLVWRARAPVPLVTSVLRMVLDAGADIDAQDESSGAPAVLYAVRAKSSAVLRILLQRGASLNFVDERGANILGELAVSGDLEGLKIVAAAHADAAADNNNMSGINVFLADTKQLTALGKWRNRVRQKKEKLEEEGLKKGGSSSCCITMIREETVVFQSLVKDIRDQQLQDDMNRLGVILQSAEATKTLSPEANDNLCQLVQRKTEMGLARDIETLRALRIQLTENMWEAAKETVEEIIDICRERIKRSPWAEDQNHWRELQVSEWVDTAPY